jgi:hypothetical protein
MLAYYSFLCGPYSTVAGGVRRNGSKQLEVLTAGVSFVGPKARIVVRPGSGERAAGLFTSEHARPAAELAAEEAPWM